MTRFRSTLPTGAVWLGALFPFILAVVFHVQGPTAQSASKGPERPALVFDQYFVNLGKVGSVAEVPVLFRFKNRSDRRVEISELAPSCGCLQPRLEKKVYEPGESGEFLLRVQTANEQPGEKHLWVDVRYQDPQPRSQRVSFTVVLPTDGVLIQPRAVAFYIQSDQPTERTITIIDRRGGGLRVTGMHSSLDLVSLRLLRESPREDGAFVIEIGMTVAGNVPAGRHTGLITVSTDDDVYSKLRVPVMIHGMEAAVAPLGAPEGTVQPAPLP